MRSTRSQQWADMVATATIMALGVCTHASFTRVIRLGDKALPFRSQLTAGSEHQEAMGINYMNTRTAQSPWPVSTAALAHSEVDLATAAGFKPMHDLVS